MNKKVERGQDTRHRMVAVATRLFGEQGYEATSIEAVLRESEVSRGALYHHFASKEQLFEAVLEAAEAEISAATIAGSRGLTDPVEALRVGCETFLELAQGGPLRQIALIDAPTALGWNKWREIEARHGLGLLKTALEAAARLGRIDPDLADTFAHILLATLIELALMIARADDPPAALESGRAALRQLIDRLLVPPAANSLV
jgi:AcrR family transcriptional regulator